MTTINRHADLPDTWPAGFHPMMRSRGGRRPPQQAAADANARAWWGLGHDLSVTDVEAREDVTADHARAVEAFTTNPTTMAPPPGSPPELKARQELAGVPPDAFAIGYPLAPGQHRAGPSLVRDAPADFVTTGTLALPIGGQPTQLVGADPYRRRLLVSAVGQVWLLGPGQQPADIGGGIASSGLLINANTANPLELRTTGAIFVWAAFSGATVTWLAEVFKATG